MTMLYGLLTQTIFEMHISPRDQIENLPTSKLAALLREHLSQGQPQNVARLLQDAFDLGSHWARKIVRVLVESGYLAKERGRFGHEVNRLTPLGRRFAEATVAPPIPRSAADNLLEQLCDAADEVSSSDEYLFLVERISAFGAYVTSEDEYLNHVSVLVELKPKESELSASGTEADLPARQHVERRLSSVSPRLDIHFNEETMPPMALCQERYVRVPVDADGNEISA